MSRAVRIVLMLLATASSCAPAERTAMGVPSDFTGVRDDAIGTVGHVGSCTRAWPKGTPPIPIIPVTTRGRRRLVLLGASGDPSVEACVRCDDARFVTISRTELHGTDSAEARKRRCAAADPAPAECPVELRAFIDFLREELARAGSLVNTPLLDCGRGYRLSVSSDDWRSANRLTEIMLRAMNTWEIGDTIPLSIEPLPNIVKE